MRKVALGIVVGAALALGCGFTSVDPPPTTEPLITDPGLQTAEQVAPEPALPEPPEPRGDVYYRSCAEAREDGAAPMGVGDPGYRPGLDRDKDGVACQ